MSDDKKRAQMGQEGATWIKQFEPNKIYDLWEETFLQIIAKKSQKALFPD